MLMLDSVSLKIPEEPGGHANHIVGEGSLHLPRLILYCPLCQEYPLLPSPEGSWWLSGPRSGTGPHHSIFKRWEQLPLLRSVYENGTAKVSPLQGLVSSGM